MPPVQTVHAIPSEQDLTAQEKANSLLNNLTPEERVGQLFLVTFQGQDISEGTSIYDLIVNKQIGGVTLLASNNNFTDNENSLREIVGMTRQIQLNQWTSSRQEIEDPISGEQFTPSYIPLFIGISQPGDGYPHDQILRNLTTLPNQMAIGATWDPDLAFRVGSVIGKELNTLGINLYLGPALDVLEDSQPEGASGLGTRAFGGDPFWVGEMGKEYIRGVHAGSEGEIAVIAQHFPGIGAADRLPEEEIATVRKSLEELDSFDLVPFFEVTGNAPTPESTVDGLLTSHIRYQGFQGNIRTTTRPVSFDQQALTLLMDLSSLSSWRANGGVMVSDNLGSRAVRLFYELTNPDQIFDARRVALNAFLAGNDLLYLGNIISGDDEDTYTTATEILEFFSQKYREDPAFAERVDQSVSRILTIKYRLYDTFTLSNTQPSLTEVDNFHTSPEISFEVAQKAATLISPSPVELDEAIPDVPNRSERIVFITDQRLTQQCDQCDQVLTPPVDALQQTITRLYGPQASGQVTPYFLKSYSYAELIRLLDGDPNAFQFETDIRRASWVVFLMLDVQRDIPESLALHRFLAEKPNLLRQKKLIAFALNAPYYLDATNISKLTAYYGLYSKSDSFIDVAARLLFRELRPEGSLPVSVAGVGYNLISATSPTPDQIIPLFLDIPTQETDENTPTPEPSPPPEYGVGNTIPVVTGVILDHNANPVPDGTPVQFIATINGEINGLPLVVNTESGIARTTIQVNESGSLEIRVESEPAKTSEILRFDIPPVPGELLTPTPTMQSTSTPTISPTATTAPAVLETGEPETPSRPNLNDWFAMVVFTFALALFSFRLMAYLGLVRWGIRSGFIASIGGLLAYSYVALRLPGSENLLNNTGGWGVLLVTFLGGIGGVSLTLVWRKVIALAKTRPVNQS